APSGPEIQHHDLAFGIRKREGRALRGLAQRELVWLLQALIGNWFGRNDRRCGLVIRLQKISSQPIFGAMCEPPDIANLLAQLFLRGDTIGAIVEREGARILPQRVVEVLLELRNFAEAFGGSAIGQSGVTRGKIFLRAGKIIELLLEAAA